MGGMRIKSLTAAFLLVLAASALSAAPESFEARVIRVIDGDSIEVRVSSAPPFEIRLVGIDAPEKGQAFGDVAKKNLAALVNDRNVRIEWADKDSRGRILGKVFLRSRDVNLAQITAGLAWHYKYYENEQSEPDRLTYGKAEQDARSQKLGLWKDPNPMPPWEKRNGPTKQSVEPAPGGPVRKSRNDICHDPSMSSYDTVKKYTSYPTLQACMDSGARLPKSQ
jgi:endonuclease YncB( thermonuclease family)